MGHQLIRPPPDDPGAPYVALFKFRTPALLDAWNACSERATLVRELLPMLREKSDRQQYSGAAAVTPGISSRQLRGAVGCLCLCLLCVATDTKQPPPPPPPRSSHFNQTAACCCWLQWCQSASSSRSTSSVSTHPLDLDQRVLGCPGGLLQRPHDAVDRAGLAMAYWPVHQPLHQYVQ